VQKNIPDLQRHQPPASRETLEDQSQEGFLQSVPDISEEQDWLDREGQKVSLPSKVKN